jgi:hypothetical protein
MGGALRDLLPQLMDFMMGQPKKKPACGGLKSIFLEEDRGDGLNYAGPKEINPI